ncbi:hypothetical protein DVA67_030790 [Solirubrobacter sp. CPCC 204708]|uniref:Sigma-70 family RNA polymerase sigma factor n=1 Tax=Solirubrobacter deserti TaxID=2282478 RepID=A0ABT4RLI0_9ACTN|nr:hypothetical protein [Solirubrobacter deserti]MBE2320391.1 hypothetical protein [Solirubrobacter deserti]MDA0139414.1 hypothetical protein [Solirubrobacter deserti]
MSPAVSRGRRAEIADFFSANHRRLERRIGYLMPGSGNVVVDDACAYAWMQLVRRDDVALDRRGFAWLSTVALHEAWRMAREDRERPAGLFWPDRELEHELPDPAGLDGDPLHQALAAELHRERVKSLDALKPPQRQALGLQALGYGYHEIAALNASSYTAVNRRLSEGRAQLRRAEGANFS